ncbi:MAG: hypothetical protein IT508_00535 [Burkholderiaceae bacterium]|nr:hypothetical protein [Burkholderiaceae bacterium]
MNWFEDLTGFREPDHASIRERLAVDGHDLVVRGSSRRYGIGELELVSLGELRERAVGTSGGSGRPRVRIVKGDARQMHHQPQYAGALFQVASQFNLLEMVSPGVTPEDGVTRYQCDNTQGPACAIAAGAATIYRNYLVPVGDSVGQTRDRQLDGLADLGEALSAALGEPVSRLWAMRNGYALCTEDGLGLIGRHLRGLDEAGRDALRSGLRIGMHWQVEVTDRTAPPRPKVSQAFCSALPVAYTRIPGQHWEPFARLVLEAAYESTLLAAALHPARGGSNVVALTRLGGGVFGNDDPWIDAAIVRALGIASGFDLDVHLVTRSQPSPVLLALAQAFS